MSGAGDCPVAALASAVAVCQANNTFAPESVEVELDLTRLEQRVHRHDYAAGPQDAVVDGRELGHVRQHDRDPVAGLHGVGCEQ